LQPLAARTGVTIENPCNDRSVPTSAVFLSGALTGGKDSSSSSATSGALGISHLSSAWSFSSQINVAAKTDTIRDGFGASLLAPGSGKALLAGLFDWRRPISRFVGCTR